MCCVRDPDTYTRLARTCLGLDLCVTVHKLEGEMCS